MKPSDSLRTRLAVAFLAAGALGLACVARAQPQSVDNVTAVAKPAHYTGPCPGEVHFLGKIFAGVPTTVSYRWERSDGEVGPVQKVLVSGGSHSIETVWRVGVRGKVFRGGERLRVLSPGDTYSIEATFSVACGGTVDPMAAALRPGD
jgi:hypothetical protein